MDRSRLLTDCVRLSLGVLKKMPELEPIYDRILYAMLISLTHMATVAIPDEVLAEVGRECGEVCDPRVYLLWQAAVLLASQPVAKQDVPVGEFN